MKFLSFIHKVDTYMRRELNKIESLKSSKKDIHTFKQSTSIEDSHRKMILDEEEGPTETIKIVNYSRLNPP